MYIVKSLLEKEVKIVDESTNEIITKKFIETKIKKKVKGGFILMYPSYEKIISEIIKSNTDYRIILEIKNLFTYKNVEIFIDRNDIANKVKCSPNKVTKIIKSLLDYYVLLRIRRGVYRLNPYLYLPYRSNAEELQEEWNEILKEKGLLKDYFNKMITIDKD